ncbi:MAG: hypothetical protein AB7L92_07945 [Alphaproteobacteria bacterium]
MNKLYIILSIAVLAVVGVLAFSATSYAKGTFASAQGHEFPPLLKPNPNKPGEASDPTAPPGPPYKYDPPDNPVIPGKPYKVTHGRNGPVTYYGWPDGTLRRTPPPPPPVPQTRVDQLDISAAALN